MKFNLKTQRSREKGRDVWGLVHVAVAVLIGYCILSPLTAGEWGRWIARSFGWLFGWVRYGIPFLWLAYGIFHLREPKRKDGTLMITLWALAALLACVQLTLFGEAAWGKNIGGVVGLSLSHLSSRLFGVTGSWILNLTGLVLVGAALGRHSPIELTARVWNILQEDIRQWGSSRHQIREKRAPVIKPQFGIKETAAPVPTSTPIISGAPPAPKITKPTVPIRSQQKSEPLSVPPKKNTIPATGEPSTYQLPPLSLLSEPVPDNRRDQTDQLKSKANLLEQTLAHFNITAQVIEIHPGPVVTRYDLEPAPGIKVASIASRSNDITLALKATSVRVLAPVPGKGAVGIEIPNDKAIPVKLREILEAPAFQNHCSPLTFALGKSVSGEACVADLAQMPHLLIAGSTGSGKSVCIHSLILSLVFRSSPNLVKLVLIDPKRLELPSYEGIPHLYDPRNPADQASVITLPKEAAKALQRLIKIMEIRYEAFAKANVRNIEGYNEKRAQSELPPEHYLVVIIDELADLMLTVPKEIEDCVQRLAQMARAVGIHLVLATQRPSVDVITGVIKANLPSRIALRVASQTDSRVIIDSSGAECLLGAGDMLFLPSGSPQTVRVQGAYVSSSEVESVVNFLKKQGGPFYENLFATASLDSLGLQDDDELIDLREALTLIQQRRRVSQDLLKAHLGSSARATNILSLLEVKGFIHKPEGTNRWEIYYDRVEEFLKSQGNPILEKSGEKT